jgi:outer membrane protein TolC
LYTRRSFTVTDIYVSPAHGASSTSIMHWIIAHRWIPAVAGVLLLCAPDRGSAQTPPPSPLTLDEAVLHAVGNYPAIAAAAARVAAQEAGVALARTVYLPRADYGFQLNRATRNNVAGLLLPGTPVPAISGPVSEATSSSTIWGSASALLLSWEAFDFGVRGATVDLAQAQLARAQAAAQQTQLDVAIRTADAFLRLAVAEETLRAARANLQRQEVFANTVAVLVKTALRPGADESRAQAELALARIQIIQAEQAEAIARADLAQWLGVTSDAVQIAVDALLERMPQALSTTSATAHPLAAGQRAAVNTSRAARQMVDRAYVPRISLHTALSVRGSGALASGATAGGADGLTFDTPNWAAGVTATLPLFDWFTLRRRSHLEAENERAERAAYDRVLRELTTQTDQARAEMEGARRVAENTPIQLDAARILERQSRARYDAGLATIVEVADAQRLLLQSEVGNAVARLGVWRALVTAAAAQGDAAVLLR